MFNWSEIYLEKKYYLFIRDFNKVLSKQQCKISYFSDLNWNERYKTMGWNVSF